MSEPPSRPFPAEQFITGVLGTLAAGPICQSGWATLWANEVGSAQWGKGVFGFGAGLVIGGAAWSYTWWRRFLAAPKRQWLHDEAWKWWVPITFIGVFVYVVVPDVVHRAMVPTLPRNVLFSGPAGDEVYDGRPLGIWWGGTYLQVDRAPGPDPLLSVTAFDIQGKNLGDEEVQLTAAYLISGLDGTKLPITINSLPDGWIELTDAGPVPARANFALHTSFAQKDQKALSEADFLKRWSHFSVVIQAGDEKIRHEIREADVLEWIHQNHPERLPHVTRRSP